MPKFKQFVGIDPRIGCQTKSKGCGFGVIDTTKATPTLHRSGIIYMDPKDKNLRYGTLCHSLRGVLQQYPSRSTLALLEMPSFYGKNASGLQKLVVAAGVCLGTIISCNVSYALIAPHIWKKKGNEEELRDKMGELFPEKKEVWVGEDEWVACALAHWGIENMGKYEVCQVD